MFLISRTTAIVFFVLIGLFLVYRIIATIVEKVKNKKEYEEYRIRKEKEENEKRLIEEKAIKDFRQKYSEETIEEHILELKDEEERRNKIKSFFKEKRQKAEEDRLNELGVPESNRRTGVRYCLRGSKTKYEELQDEYLKHSKTFNYKNFTFERSLTFYECLCKYLDEKGMNEPDLYNAAGVQRQTFYKIRNIEGYIPRRRTVLYFILILKLTIEEANELLSLAGYQFNPNSRLEQYIKYCIIKEKYDIDEINEYLFDNVGDIL